MALKNLDGFVELGTVGCTAAGGGIWISYLPIFVNGEKLYLTYDSEAYYNDDNTAEFLVYDGNTMDEMKEDYGDDEESPGMFIHIEKDSPLFPIYKKLRRGVVRAISKGIGFDGKPLPKGVKVMEERLKDVQNVKAEEKKRFIKKLEEVVYFESSVWNEACDLDPTFDNLTAIAFDGDVSFAVETESGNRYRITIEDLD